MAADNKIDVFKIADEHSHSFLNSNFFYFPDITKAARNGYVTIDLDPHKIAFLQLIVDGFMVEVSIGSGKYYLTGKGRNFILRGGYAQQFKDENEAHELDMSLKRNQKAVNSWSVVLTGISIVFIGVSAGLQYFDTTPKEISRLKEQLVETRNVIKQIDTSLQEINLSIRHPKNDTSLLNKDVIRPSK